MNKPVEEVTSDEVQSINVFVVQKGDVVLSIGAGKKPTDQRVSADVASKLDLNFAQLAKTWVDTAIGFLEAFPIMGAVAHIVHTHQATDQFIPMIERIAKTSNEEPDIKDGFTLRTFQIEKEHFFRVTRRIETLNRYRRAEKSFLRAQILAIVAEYEAFMCDLLRIIISRRPEAFISKDSTVLASEVIKADDLAAVRDRLIEDRIDSLQRESHVEQIKYIHDQLKIPIFDMDLLKDFAKVCEARNVLTHANGKINRQYILKLKKQGINEVELPKVGDELRIDEKFVKRSASRVFLTGFLTLHTVWQHLEKNERDDSIGQLVDTSHELLVAGFTKLAARVCKYILQEKSPARERERAYSIINLALSVRLNDEIKEDDKPTLIEEILSQKDWSIVNPLFKLALACVRNEIDDLGALIDSAVADGLRKNDLLTWALFIKVRQTEIFRERVRFHCGVEIDIDPPKKEETADEQSAISLRLEEEDRRKTEA